MNDCLYGVCEQEKSSFEWACGIITLCCKLMMVVTWSMVVTWWIVAFLHSVSRSGFVWQHTRKFFLDCSKTKQFFVIAFSPVASRSILVTLLVIVLISRHFRVFSNIVTVHYLSRLCITWSITWLPWWVITCVVWYRYVIIVSLNHLQAYFGASI